MAVTERVHAWLYIRVAIKNGSTVCIRYTSLYSDINFAVHGKSISRNCPTHASNYVMLVKLSYWYFCMPPYQHIWLSYVTGSAF